MLAIALAEAEEAVVDVVDLLLRPVAHEEVLQRLQQAGVQNAEQLVAGAPHDVGRFAGRGGGHELTGHGVPLLRLDHDLDAGVLFFKAVDHLLKGDGTAVAGVGGVQERPHADGDVAGCGGRLVLGFGGISGIGGVGGRGRARLRGGGGVRVGRSAATGSKRGQHQDGKEQCDNHFHNDPPILIYLISQ